MKKARMATPSGPFGLLKLRQVLLGVHRPHGCNATDPSGRIEKTTTGAHEMAEHRA